MRLSNLFGASNADRQNEATGVTIDVMTGIVAGLALVLAILILASSLNQAQATVPPHASASATR
jgi:hypothetical protein